MTISYPAKEFLQTIFKTPYLKNLYLSPTMSIYDTLIGSPATTLKRYLLKSDVAVTYTSPSTYVENEDSSFGFNQNCSPMPPWVLGTKSKTIINTLPPKKSHKRTNTDIIGIHSMTSQNSSGSSYFQLLDLLAGLGELIYDDEAMKGFYYEFMNLDNKNAFNNDENLNNLMITFTNLGGASNANESGLKIGATTSGVKTKVDEDIEPLCRHYKCATMDSSFIHWITHWNLLDQVFSSNFVGEGEYYTDPNEVKRILENRDLDTRSKQGKSLYIVDLEGSVRIHVMANTSLYGMIVLLEVRHITLAKKKNDVDDEREQENEDSS
ncbi:unnamed protein product [Arabidopsis thaliana]|uniref:Uncharacterized protein n=1 Tax=Arabidopsis thaliana TaxID=3702 RepID=A0A654EVN1_ARATH|nr:unnamed protein product [Arabidopsis thaliana]